MAKKKQKNYVLVPTWSSKLNIWVAFWIKGIIGIEIFEEYLNADKYLSILKSVLLKGTTKIKKKDWVF